MWQGWIGGGLKKKMYALTMKIFKFVASKRSLSQSGKTPPIVSLNEAECSSVAGCVLTMYETPGSCSESQLPIKERERLNETELKTNKQKKLC